MGNGLVDSGTVEIDGDGNFGVSEVLAVAGEVAEVEKRESIDVLEVEGAEFGLVEAAEVDSEELWASFCVVLDVNIDGVGPSVLRATWYV